MYSVVGNGNVIGEGTVLGNVVIGSSTRRILIKSAHPFTVNGDKIEAEGEVEIDITGLDKNDLVIDIADCKSVSVRGKVQKLSCDNSSVEVRGSVDQMDIIGGQVSVKGKINKQTITGGSCSMSFK